MLQKILTNQILDPSLKKYDIRNIFRIISGEMAFFWGLTEAGIELGATENHIGRWVEIYANEGL